MVATTPREVLGITDPALEPEKALTRELLYALDASSETFATRIRGGAVTVDELESFFQKQPEILAIRKDSLLGFLLEKGSNLFLRDDCADDVLEFAERALAHDKGCPLYWLAKGAALLRLKGFEEAFSSYERFSPQIDQYLPILFHTWSGCALHQGPTGTLRLDVSSAERGVE